jgi:hypothetical protein
MDQVWMDFVMEAEVHLARMRSSQKLPSSDCVTGRLSAAVNALTNATRAYRVEATLRDLKAEAQMAMGNADALWTGEGSVSP